VQDLPDGYLDALSPEAEGPDQPRWGAALSEPCGWDASAGARRDGAADVARQPRALVDADAEKSAAREQACQEQGVRFPWVIQRLEPLDAGAELYRQDVDPFAERSSAAREAAVSPELEGQPVAAEQLAEPTLRSAAAQV